MIAAKFYCLLAVVTIAAGYGYNNELEYETEYEASFADDQQMNAEKRFPPKKPIIRNQLDPSDPFIHMIAQWARTIDPMEMRSAKKRLIIPRLYTFKR